MSEKEQEKDAMGSTHDSNEDDRVQRVLEAFESEHEKSKGKIKKVREIDLRPTRREGVYMLLFQMMLVVVMGGTHGFMSQYLENPPSATSIQQDFWQEVAINAGDLASGFLVHLSEIWYVDLLIVTVTILIAFGVKDVRRRRRYFGWLTALTIVVMSAFVLSPMRHILESAASAV